MGMHHGYLAIEAPMARALDAIGDLTGRFVLGATVARFEDLVLEDDDDGWQMAIGERDGRTYILDTSMMLGSDPDLVASLSARIAGTVVGAGAETVSGTFWFVAASSGAVRRFHWNGYDSVDEPFDIGELLASEIDQPLEDLDGEGLLAATDSFGFALAEWAEHGPWQALTYTAEAMPDEGPLGAELSAHLAAHPVEGGEAPTVVRRTDPGGEAGFDLAHPRLAEADQPALPLPTDRQVVEAVRRRPSTLVWLAVVAVIAVVLAWILSQLTGNVLLSLVIGVLAALAIGRGMMALAGTVSRDE
jgi:hypothetical protein